VKKSEVHQVDQRRTTLKTAKKRQKTPKSSFFDQISASRTSFAPKPSYEHPKNDQENLLSEVNPMQLVRVLDEASLRRTDFYN
jgi:hypothetical protein